MFYNLLFAPSFNKDFSHLQGPPTCANWDKFKKGAYGYVIQQHNTSKGDKNFFFVSNTHEFLAFGLYASIHDFAALGRVDQKYAMRRRGGDHSTKTSGEGDYPTEAAIGYYWDKTSGSAIADNVYLDISIDSLLKMFEQEIIPYWDRPRSAISAREHIVQPATIESRSTPYVKIDGKDKNINAIIDQKKDLIKIPEQSEESVFYALVHAVLHNKIDRDFNFCTDFNSKSFFKGQKSMNIGTIRKKGFLRSKSQKPAPKTPNTAELDMDHSTV